MKVSDPIIFSTQSYGYLSDEIAALLKAERGTIETRRFPDGERYQRVVTPASDRDVVVVGGTIDDSNTLELYDLASALAKAGVNSLTLLIPYFGYSTMERAVRPGEVVTAKTRCRLLSAVPLAAGGNRVVLLDLHSEGIPHYFEGGIVPLHIYAKSLIRETCRALAGADFILACTDAGRAKWVESLANDLGVNAAFIFKRRIDGDSTEVLAVNAQVQGRDVVIYDDMIRTGGSLLNAARAYKEAGARRIWAITTHGVFPENALGRLCESGLFERVVATNSHPRALALSHPLFEIKTVAPLFAAALGDLG